MNDVIEQAQAAIARLTEYRQTLITSVVTGKVGMRGFGNVHKE